MSASTDRAARLNDLILAVDKWAKARTAFTNKIIASQKKLLDARGQPTQSAVDAASTVVVDQLKEFTG